MYANSSIDQQVTREVTRAGAVTWPQHQSPVNANLSWYALRVRHKSEFLVGRHLGDRGFEYIVPAQMSTRQWSDRRVTTLLPLFPGYVLCRFDAIQPTLVLSSPAVCSVVSFAERFAPIDEAEIATLKLFIKHEMPLSSTHNFSAGQKVRVMEGPLTGVEGFIEETKPNVLLVRIRLLERAISVQVKWSSLARISESSTAL